MHHNEEVVYLRFPDPEYAEAFRAYSNYVVDISAEVVASFGWNSPTLVQGVLDGVSLHLSGHGIQRRRLSEGELALLERTLRRSWSYLRRLRREVDDIDTFDEESNAWLPVQAYYAVYNGIRAFAIASGQSAKEDHRRALNLASQAVQRGLLPYPWSIYCDGCPQTQSHSIHGVSSVESVHPLSAPHPDTATDRLAMFLRTTRAKELDRRFSEERVKNVRPGQTRRNLSRGRKEEIANRLMPTTVFDLFYRLRIKANYDDADTFVLGAAGVADARAFADSLAILADASVAGLEGLVVAYVGPDLIGVFAEQYRDRIHAGPASPVSVRAGILGQGMTGLDSEPPF